MIEKFQRLKSFIYQLAFMFLFFVLAKSCVSDYVNGGDKERIAQCKQMISENSFVYADVAEEYTETTVARVAKTYTFDYSFSIDNQEYSGKVTLREIPSIPKLKLFYLTSNPNIVEHDPWQSIEDEEDKGSFMDLLGGIIFGLLGFALLISFIILAIGKIQKRTSKKETSKVKKVKPKKEKPLIDKEEKEELSEEEKQRLAEEKERIRKEKEDPRRFMPK